MAPLTRRQKKALAAAPPAPVINPEDLISKLPEEIQVQIVSFLPAHEAVRTCVLARTWRDVWKSSRRLLITGDSVKEVREFVDGPLRARGDASLDVSEFEFHQVKEVDEDGYKDYEDDDDDESLNKWIHRVLEYQTKMLQININTHGNFGGYLYMGNMPLLELTGVSFQCRYLNLHGCPALEHLEINDCRLRDVRKMASRSLKRLVIRSCNSYDVEKCIQICAPRLVSLWLYLDESLRTPLLNTMPHLVNARVQITSYEDYCVYDDPMACYHVTRAADTSDIDSDDDDSDNNDDEEGSPGGQNTTKCVVLEGLAQARDLLLIADSPTYIFRRDLRWCPTFSNLKTLVVNHYWCGSADCSALACILQHSPVLEKLTVLFYGTVKSKYNTVVKLRPHATGNSTMISPHLKIIELKYSKVDAMVVKVQIFLGTLNIRFHPVRVIEGSK